MDAVRPRLITAGRVITPSGELAPGTVEIADGRIAAIRGDVAGDAEVTQPDGILIPGFIDLQINGAAGVDFLSRPTDVAVARVCGYLASTGVTAFLPTLVSAPSAHLARALRSWHQLAHRPGAPRVLGVHLEGPYLSPQYKGAHPRQYLTTPDVARMAAWLDIAPGLVRLVTLAPELPGAGDVVRMLRDRGCVVAAGHTAATYDQAQAAFAAGVSLVTHLFNAMRPVHHRDPGIVVAALEHPHVAVSLIVDFMHVHPAVVQLAVRVKGWEQTVLITDAIAAAGARGRAARLGLRTVRVTDVPRLPGGTIAGSLLSMDRALRHVVSLGVPLRHAVWMTSTGPARVLGHADLGAIETGRVADLVMLSNDLQVRAVYLAGELIHRAP